MLAHTLAALALFVRPDAVREAVRASPLASAAAAFIVGVAVGGAGGREVELALTQFSTVDDIPIQLFREHKTLTARVVKVSDGDTFRVVHTPLLGRPKKVSKLEGGSAKLSESTLQIRIAAIDCPEVAKGGRPGQPLGQEAADFARGRLEGRTVRVKLLARDQYKRAVATVSYQDGPLPFSRHDVGQELLERGLARVYRQSGAEYDGPVESWDKIEQRAKRAGAGMWASPEQAEANDPARFKRGARAAGGARGGG